MEKVRIPGCTSSEHSARLTHLTHPPYPPSVPLKHRILTANSLLGLSACQYAISTRGKFLTRMPDKMCFAPMKFHTRYIFLYYLLLLCR